MAHVRVVAKDRSAGKRASPPKRDETSALVTDEGSAVFSESRVPPPASPELQKIAHGIVEDSDRLVDRMIEMIHGLPDYKPIKDETFWSEVRQILKVTIPLFFRAALEGQPASEGEISTARYFARRRAHQGITLRGHLTAYRNGMWMLWEALVNATSSSPKHQAELLLRAAWVFRHLDVISGAVTEAYLAEQEGRARDRDRMLRNLLDEIVEGGPSSPEDLAARALPLGIDVETPLDVVLVGHPARTGPSSETTVLPSLASPVAVAISEAADVPVERIVGVERNRILLLFAPEGLTRANAKAAAKKLDEALEAPRGGGQPVSIGVSGPIHGIAGIRQGIREATRAVELGHLLHPDRSVFFYRDFVLDDVLESGGRAAGRLVRETLGVLLEQGTTGERYLETLVAYFAAGSNLKVAAAALGIHPNTLAYRMRQIHRVTGTDFSEPETRLRAEVSLRLLRFEERREEATRRRAEAANRKD